MASRCLSITPSWLLLTSAIRPMVSWSSVSCQKESISRSWPLSRIVKSWRRRFYTGTRCGRKPRDRDGDRVDIGVDNCGLLLGGTGNGKKKGASDARSEYRSSDVSCMRSVYSVSPSALQMCPLACEMRQPESGSIASRQ